MSSGLDTHDSYLYEWRGLGEMGRSTDWVEYVLDLPLTEAPGFTKVSLKLDINEYVIGQSWHGLRKLSLENGSITREEENNLR